MKPHRIELDRNRLRVDGVPLLVTERGIDNIVTHLPDFHEVTVTLFAEEVVLSGDTHDQDEPTPIYDEMVEELDVMEEVRRNWEETNHEALRGLGLA